MLGFRLAVLERLAPRTSHTRDVLSEGNRAPVTESTAQRTPQQPTPSAETCRLTLTARLFSEVPSALDRVREHHELLVLLAVHPAQTVFLANRIANSEQALVEL